MVFVGAELETRDKKESKGQSKVQKLISPPAAPGFKIRHLRKVKHFCSHLLKGRLRSATNREIPRQGN